MSRLEDVTPKAEGETIALKKTFKGYQPCFVHIDIKYVPQMPEETSRSYLFVAIDRATRWVFMHINADLTGKSSVDFVRRLKLASPIRINRTLTITARNSPTMSPSKTRNPAASTPSTRPVPRSPSNTTGTAASSANERRGRTLQWSNRRTGAADSVRQPCRPGSDLDKLFEAVEPPPTA
jgi:hypothetical protein